MSDPPPKTTFRLPADNDGLAALVGQLIQFLDALPTAVHPHDRYDFSLALHELFANIVNHGMCGGQEVIISLGVCEEPAVLTADIEDRGRPFSPATIACPAPQLLQEGGYGLFIMHQLLDEVAVTPHAEGNRWRLSKRLTPPPPAAENEKAG